MNDSSPQGCYVVLHIGTGPSASAEKKGSPLVVSDESSRFPLNDDIWIERFDEQLAKNIQKACNPPHYKINDAGYDGHLYAFVRSVPTIERSKFEGMTELHTVIAFSRLVNPTSTGDRFSAWVFQFRTNDSPIYATQYRGVSLDVSLATNSRDWLSVEDGEVLRKLMPWLSRDMYPRVHRAFWNHEHAMHSCYLDVRWTFVVSGLEALINVGKTNSGRQFHDRVRLLAAELQIDLSDADLENAWDLRSKLVHAEGFLSQLDTILPQSEHSPLYQKLESILRETVRRCLLDQEFEDSFRNDDAVKARFPSSA